MRKCCDCQLCCKLVPVKSLSKPGGQTCAHQKFHKGCAIYHSARMPAECWIWNCRWLVNDDTDDLSRPDRSHYVIDIMPDFLTLRDPGGAAQNIEVVQIWADPNYPDAHRDPALRRYLMRRAQDGIAALVRFNSRDAIAIFAPPFDAVGKWHEIRSGLSPERTHTFAEIALALSGRAATAE